MIVKVSRQEAAELIGQHVGRGMPNGPAELRWVLVNGELSHIEIEYGLRSMPGPGNEQEQP